MKKRIKGQINMTAHYGNYGKLTKNNKPTLLANKELRKLKILKSGLLFAIFLTCVVAIRILFSSFSDVFLVDYENKGTVSSTEEEIEESFDESSLLFLVDKDNPLDEDFEIELVDFENIQINEIILSSLMLMLEKANNDGVDISFIVGYISAEEQEFLYESEVQRLVEEGYTKVMANAKASENVAEANESEMQTGLCLEVYYYVEFDNITDEIDDETNSQTEETVIEQSFLDSEEYAWLVKNANDYGFIFRYPSDKTSVTGVSGRENVLRYVGIDSAVEMKNSSYCLEEYIDYLGL